MYFDNTCSSFLKLVAPLISYLLGPLWPILSSILHTDINTAIIKCKSGWNLSCFSAILEKLQSLQHGVSRPHFIPGCFSLTSTSLEERVCCEHWRGEEAETPATERLGQRPHLLLITSGSVCSRVYLVCAPLLSRQRLRRCITSLIYIAQSIAFSVGLGLCLLMLPLLMRLQASPLG